MKMLKNKIVVVAGGTGNVGSFIVKDLLQRGATVAVPSRSEEKINELKSYLSQKLDNDQLENLNTFVGDIGDEEGAKKLLSEITEQVGNPNAAVASLGHFIPAPSLLDTSVEKLQQVVNSYLVSHFVAARALLNIFKETGGTYVFINGPLALAPWEGSGAGLVSTVTAGQQMLFKTLAQELEASKATVTELVNYAYIRDKTNQPSSKISGEATGAYTSYLLSDEADNIHGKTIKLQSPEQLNDVGIKIEDK